MSINNGVYVLQTSGPEFRVVYCHAIDNIYGKFNTETSRWEGDMDRMIDYFGASEVFLDIGLALDKAEDMSYDYPYLEDGVCLITDFKAMKFGAM
jgi:hypothetical protein